MKNKINQKLFFVLLGAGFVTTLMVLPYTVALSPEIAKIMTPVVIAAQVVQATILFAIAIYFGLRLAKLTEFKLSILEKVVEGKKWGNDFKSILPISVGMGILAGILIILFSFLFGTISLPLLKAEIAISIWKSIFASFYGGVGEELLLRLFFMTMLVWVSTKILKTNDGKPTQAGVWTAIIISSIIFGLGHLPVTGSMTTITLEVIARAILLNGIGGVIFGWLYWKKGLESAMVAHFSADLVIHVITPIVASLLI